jgi:hypothetical protein
MKIWRENADDQDDLSHYQWLQHPISIWLSSSLFRSFQTHKSCRGKEHTSSYSARGSQDLPMDYYLTSFCGSRESGTSSFTTGMKSQWFATEMFLSKNHEKSFGEGKEILRVLCKGASKSLYKNVWSLVESLPVLRKICFFTFLLFLLSWGFIHSHVWFLMPSSFFVLICLSLYRSWLLSCHRCCILAHSLIHTFMSTTQIFFISLSFHSPYVIFRTELLNSFAVVLLFGSSSIILLQVLDFRCLYQNRPLLLSREGLFDLVRESSLSVSFCFFFSSTAFCFCLILLLLSFLDSIRSLSSFL